MKQNLTAFIFCLALCACSNSNGNVDASRAGELNHEGSTRQSFSEPLQLEEVGASDTLPETYPSSWVFAHDMNFYSILDGKIVLIDVASDAYEYKGLLTAGQFATFAQSKSLNELYVAETFLSRGTRGERTDVLTIYDKKTLKVIDELVLPGGKRGQTVTQRGAFQLIDNDRLGLIFNFTPASSISVIDLAKREVVTEIPTPGCALSFPLKGAAFGTLCGNGTVSSFSLDGANVQQVSTEPFNDISNDAMFLKSTQIGNVRYFPTFTGNVRPIDVSSQTAKPLPAWSLVGAAERKANWRPSGWQIVTSDAQGHLYVLMDKGVIDGGHKSGGSEIWVFDPQTQKRIRQFKLENGGLTIEATRGEGGLLVVTNAAMGLDIYSLDGKLQRTISAGDTATPFVIHAAK